MVNYPADGDGCAGCALTVSTQLLKVPYGVSLTTAAVLPLAVVTATAVSGGLRCTLPPSAACETSPRHTV